MDGASAVRRAFHLASPVFLGYYALPEDLGGGVTRTSVTLLFLGTAMCVEVGRIALGVHIFGFREYEGERVSAYAQGALGLAYGLFVIQDPRIVVPVFIGMAWIDPLCALTRKRKWHRGVSYLSYAGVFLAVEAVMEPLLEAAYPWSARVLFAALATATAVPLEGRRVSHLDDDLLMLVVPMTLLGVAAAVLVPLGLR